MDRIINIIPATNEELYVISARKGLVLARFEGRCIERTKFVSILGTVQKGTKTIYVSFIVCGDLEYQIEIDNGYIQSGKVYDVFADVDGER